MTRQTMQSLKEKYRPATLKEISGQPAAIKALASIVANPRSCCILLTGATGTGKSSAAGALANELGCNDGALMETAYTISGSELNAETLRKYFGNESPFRLIATGGWHVLIIEEMEFVNWSILPLLKDALERRVAAYGNVIVIATSNSTEGIPQAVLDRFKRYDFDSGYKLASDYARYIQAIWSAETNNAPLPDDWKAWGWNYDTEEFSARRAIDAMEEAIFAVASI